MKEQEKETGFILCDEMDGHDIRLDISDGHEENFPDCVTIETELGMNIILGPSSAIRLLKWLEAHHDRLTQAAIRCEAEARGI